MSGSPVSFPSHSKSDASPAVNAEVSFGLNSSPFDNDHLVHEIISIIGDSCFERISRRYSEEVGSSRDFSFDALFSEDEVESDHVFAFMPRSPHATGSSTSLAFLTSEMQENAG